MDPHSPYVPHKTKHSIYETKTMSKNERFYNDEVEYVDYCIGELVKTLEDLKFSDDSILIVTADHGEGFGEHNVFQHFKHVLYEELIHVPLIIHGLHQRREINQPVGLTDLAPTILSSLEIRKPKTFCGKSLLPLIEERKETKDGVISESAHYNLKDFTYDFRKSIYSYREHKWKLILDNINGKNELYNLQADPHEQMNLFQSKKEIARILTRKLDKHIRLEKKIRHRPISI